MLVRYDTDRQECSAHSSQRNERINVDESIICKEECVDLGGDLSKDRGKSRPINVRPSKRNAGKQGHSILSIRPLKHRPNNNTRLRVLAPMNHTGTPSEPGDNHLSQEIERTCSGQENSRRALLPDSLYFSANMGHPISDLSPEHNRNTSTMSRLPTSPQLDPVMGGSFQHMKTEVKLEAPVSGLQTNQDTINLMKRPAEDNNAPPNKRRKTKSHNDVEESDHDRDYYSGSGAVEKKKQETFACPFYRKDPVRFLECINLRMVTISIVKQHLKRRHAANLYCSVCKQGFPSSKLYEDHLQRGSCSRSVIDSSHTIPPHILEALKLRSDRRISSEAQWQEIYVLIFGTSDTIPKPFLDGIAQEMTGIIRDIWRQDGSQIVSKSVQERGLPATPGQLFDILPELLDKVEDRFENKPLKQESDEQLPNIKRAMTETNIRARDDSYQGSTSLEHYPNAGVYASDFDSMSSSAFLPSDFLKSMSFAGNHSDLQSVEEAFGPEETDSEYATTSFAGHTEPLICMTAFDPADRPYDIFQQGPLSQTAGTDIYEDWLGLSEDYSLNFLEE
ncbi:hypothetical protein FVEG_07591 [Fusarium verticillioides 7600]|uniref:C2H2-type domain-containing protein n=1 Tax=Gibberella moniliformis (strain M3125 / FGSC 7600) TaxID=334819 RepID=W7M941_GIBM7|nr:hypothetical protein FVEG_07591 [Fusarium verticillioides 7600]EWG47511.1 hypothetical protein FVEG_07591 [Fusarium verticillioides 7600]